MHAVAYCFLEYDYSTCINFYYSFVFLVYIQSGFIKIYTLAVIFFGVILFGDLFFRVGLLVALFALSSLMFRLGLLLEVSA